MNPGEFHSWLRANSRPPLVMGVVNVTPDSFSDGGRYFSPQSAISHAEELVRQGASLLDLGGESTRPGSAPVNSGEQLRRILPVIKALRGQNLAVTISVDTTSAEVASAALDAGADLVNDISGGRFDLGMLPLVAARQVPVVLMHIQGTPATMQVDPRYVDVTAEVTGALRERYEAAVSAGVNSESILLDPGIGFGKTVTHNLQLLRDVGRMAAALPRPLVLGTSRKKFVGAIAGEPDPGNRLFGTAATVAWCVTNGAAVVRVHDVAAMSRVVRMLRAIIEADPDPQPAPAWAKG
jgi:dihydropteroate synthase